MQSKRWVFTINNYTPPTDNVDSWPDISYLAMAQEIAPDTGTPHLQGFVIFTMNKRLSAMKKMHPTAHFEVMAGTIDQSLEYISKEAAELFVIGEKPVTPADKGVAEKRRWDEIRASAQAGDLAAIESKVFIVHYNNLKRIAKDHMKKPPNLEGVCGFWFWGRSGTGKTTEARNEYPDAFIKPRNPWWDGYQGEEVAIMDDFDKYHKSLGGYLKDWGDKWAFKAEEKYGYMFIRPKMFIVTSQYCIDEIFDDFETREALHRRYTEREFTILWINNPLNPEYVPADPFDVNNIVAHFNI